MSAEALKKLFASYGYRPFKLSRFEDYDLYARNKDFLRGTGILTFTDRDGTLRALKPDITLSIVKNNGDKTEKVYYNETVCRVKDDRFREIPQAGIECLGRIDAYLEAEVIALAVKAMRCYSDRVILRVSDAGLVHSLFRQNGISENAEPEFLSYLAAKNEGAIRLAGQRLGLFEDQVTFLTGLCGIYLPLSEGAEVLREKAVSPDVLKSVEHLKTLADTLEVFGTGNEVYLDLSVTNSMDYYNGLVFQGAIAGLPSSILSGGRYDKLPGKMGYSIGAVGFAMYLDEIERVHGKKNRYTADLVITYKESDRAARLAALAQGFTALGYSVCVISEGELVKMNPAPLSEQVLDLDAAERVLKDRREEKG